MGTQHIWPSDLVTSHLELLVAGHICRDDKSVHGQVSERLRSVKNLWVYWSYLLYERVTFNLELTKTPLPFLPPPQCFQVMLAASYWSLLAPAIDMAEDSGKYGSFAFVPVALGFILGAAFVYAADVLMSLLVRDWCSNGVCWIKWYQIKCSNSVCALVSLCMCASRCLMCPCSFVLFRPEQRNVQMVPVEVWMSLCLQNCPHTSFLSPCLLHWLLQCLLAWRQTCWAVIMVSTKSTGITNTGGGSIWTAAGGTFTGPQQTLQLNEKNDGEEWEAEREKERLRLYIGVRRYVSIVIFNIST